MSLQAFGKRIIFRALRLVTARRQPEANCILVLQAMLPLGGCVHATPLFALLKRDLPDLPVWVATRGLGLEVLRNNPDIAGLISVPDMFSAFQLAGSTLRSALKALSLRPRWVVVDSSNPRTKIALLGALYSGAPMIGYSEAAALLKLPLTRNSQTRSLLEDNLRIGRSMGASSTHFEPRVCFSAASATRAQRLLQGDDSPGRPVAVLSTQPSGGQPTAWHAHRFAEVAEQLQQRGFLPVFVGTANQTEQIENLRQSITATTVSLTGQTDIGLLAAVLAGADLCISIDTGTMHVARAVGVPLVVLAPVFQSPVEWLPLDVPQVRVLRDAGVRTVPPDYRLDEIETATVLAAVDDLLRAYPPSPAARAARIAASTTAVDHLA